MSEELRQYGEYRVRGEVIEEESDQEFPPPPSEAEKVKMAVLKVCSDRIEKYPDGPFVVPITDIFRAIGMVMRDV